ncbi:MAG: YqgE/AlgH family protein [Proteobacteria bacterium]|nr:YqgE/AlgH family protein [Pseudomonadota bacterium]
MALLPVVALQPAQGQYAGPYLKGQLLVAQPTMRDPRFAETVILMIEHDANGAFGVIVNKPAGSGPLAKLLGGFGLDPDATDADVTIYYGGPVSPGIGILLHSDDYRRDGTRVLSGGLALSRDPKLLADVAHDHGPARYKLILGYAGWGPRQLEGEISRGDWVSAPLDAALILDTDSEQIWRRAGKSSGLPL